MKALILVDIQNDFLPGGTLAVPEGDEILPVVNQILSFPFDAIVATKDWHPPDHVSFAPNHNKAVGQTVLLDDLEQILWPVHCVQNTPGSGLSPAINKEKIEKVFHKGTDEAIDSYSTFFDNRHLKATGLGDYLKERGIEDIYLAGLATDYCVKYSALDALKLGFNVFVITDACRGVDLQSDDSKKALDEVAAAGAHLTTSHEIAEKTFGVAGFEPTTSSSRTKRASQTALHPEANKE